MLGTLVFGFSAGVVWTLVVSFTVQRIVRIKREASRKAKREDQDYFESLIIDMKGE